MRLIVDLLLWIDQSPVRYWSVALSISALFLLICFWPAFRETKPSRRIYRWLGSDFLFLTFIPLVLLAFRWPILSIPRDLNPDESSFISQALTLRHDPVFWRSVSAGTSGPLNVFPLLIPWLLGFPINYPAARLIGLCCLVGALIFFYLTCRRFAPPVFARVAVLPPLTFFALTTHSDFVHYSSEHVPLFLLTLAFFLAMKLAENERKLRTISFLTGCVLGAIPFAKLQATLAALTITAFCYLFLWLRREYPKPFRLACFGWMTAGGLSVPLIFILITALGGAFEHFWQSYIIANLAYVHTGAVPEQHADGRLQTALSFFHQYTQAFNWYSIGLVVAGLLGCAVIAYRNLRWNTHTRLVTFSTAVLIASVALVIAPGRAYVHYLLFLIFPLATWAFAMIATAIAYPASKFQKIIVPGAVISWCVLGVAWQVLTFPHIEARRLGLLKTILERPPTEVTKTILRFASPDDLLPVWGWYYDLNVQTGMGRATSDNYFDYMRVYGGTVPEYFKNLYIADIRRANPPVFVDAVSPETFELGSPAQFGYESFLPLSKFVQENYVAVANIRGIRIFVRKDRFQEVLKHPPEYASQQLTIVKNSVDEDLSYYVKTLSFDPENEMAHVNVGIALCQKDEYEEGKRHFRKALEIHPGYAPAHVNLGVVLLSAGHPDEAIDHFKAALKIEPHDAIVHNNLASALFQKGELEEAIAEFRKAAELNPNLAEVHDSLGTALARNGEFEEAITQYQEALRLSPSFVAAYTHLGNVFASQKNTLEAIRSYRKALELNPNFKEARENLARLSSNGGEVAAYNERGNTLLKAGKVDEAIASYQKAIQLNSRDPEAQSNLGVALAMKGKTNEAIEAFNESLKLDSNSASTHNNLANLLEEKGSLEDAAKHFQIAAQLAPSDAEAQFHAGRLFARLGQKDEAATYLNKALKLKPDFVEAKEILTSLEAKR